MMREAGIRFSENLMLSVWEANQATVQNSEDPGGAGAEDRAAPGDG